ncbi:MAG: alkaline phosphatase family protein, partial [Polaromonas sp.]
LWFCAQLQNIVGPDARKLDRIKTVVVICAENHSLDNLYGLFPGRAQHLKDGDNFTADIAAGKLPAVKFHKPAGRDNQGPSYTDIMSGDAHIAGVLEKLRASPQWPGMLIVITYDENGGYWDHVPPPPSGPGWSDRWDPGNRVPTLLIGPHVKRGHIDSTAYDTTSILKIVTRRFGLEPLPGVRANVGDLTAALD